MSDVLSWTKVEGLDDLPAGLSVLACGEPRAVQTFLYRCVTESLARGVHTSLVETVVPPVYVLSALADQHPRGKGGHDDGTAAVDVLPRVVREYLRVIDCSELFSRRLEDRPPQCPVGIEDGARTDGDHGRASVDTHRMDVRRSLPRGAGLSLVDATAVRTRWNETLAIDELVRRVDPGVPAISKAIVERSLECPEQCHVLVHRLDELWHCSSEQRLRSTLSGLNQRHTRSNHVAVAGFGKPVDFDGVRSLEDLFDLRIEVRTAPQDVARVHPVGDVPGDIEGLFAGERLEARVEPISDVAGLDPVRGLWHTLSGGSFRGVQTPGTDSDP